MVLLHLNIRIVPISGSSQTSRAGSCGAALTGRQTSEVWRLHACYLLREALGKQEFVPYSRNTILYIDMIGCSAMIGGEAAGDTLGIGVLRSHSMGFREPGAWHIEL